MLKLFVAIYSALIAFHVLTHYSPAASVLTLLVYVVGFALLDGAAALARKMKAAPPASEARR